MAKQSSVLNVLCSAGPDNVSLNVNDIMAALEKSSGEKPSRRRVYIALNALIRRGFAKKARWIVRRIGEAATLEYHATGEGYVHRREGNRIVSGPRGAHNGVRKFKSANTFRERIWRALRLKKKATVPDLVELARQDHDEGALASNTRLYLKALNRAGVVTRLKTREPGSSPNSNGFARYALVRDLGVDAPRAGRKGLFDPNSSETLAYGDAQPEPSKRKPA